MVMVRKAPTRRVHPHEGHVMTSPPALAPPGARRRRRRGDRPADRRRARPSGRRGPGANLGPDRPGHLGHARQRLQLGLLPRTPSTTTARTTTSASPRSSTLVNQIRAERRRRAARCCSTPATPSRARRWPTTTPRSSRSPDRRDAPDGAGDERHRVRRGDARQPRVQLRPAAAATWSRQLGFPAARPPTRSTPKTGKPAFPPYVIKTMRCRAASRSGSASSA